MSLKPTNQNNTKNLTNSKVKFLNYKNKYFRYSAIIALLVISLTAIGFYTKYTIDKNAEEASASGLNIPQYQETYDVDLDGKNSETDTRMISVYLQGGSAASLEPLLTQTPNAARSDASSIFRYLERLKQAGLLDVDGSGVTTASSDGRLIYRYFLGVSEQQLIDGTIERTATRKTAEEITSFIRNARI